MSKLVLGLDIGITSVGYGVIDLDENSFVDYGVRLFKEGTAADNETRRAKRSHRRLLSRKKTRLADLRKLLKAYQIIDDEQFESLDNVYEIRKLGLTSQLTNEQLASAMLHIAKHRGSSIDTIDDQKENEKEAEALKDTLSKNAILLSSGKYVCEIQLERMKEDGKVRGHQNNFKTSDYLNEAKEILNHQQIDENLKTQILEIIARKRAYYEGPGSFNSPTPYGRFIEVDGQIHEIDLIEKMRGKCSIYPNELRAPKMSITAELFNFLNDLNNLSVKDHKLDIASKKEILMAVSQNGGITFKQLAKKIGVNEEDIKGYRIDTKKKPLLTEFKGFKVMRKIFSQCSQIVSLEDYEMLDDLIEIITKKKGIEERKEAFVQTGYPLSDELIEKLAVVSGVTGYHSLSLKAMRELNTEMYETTFNQMQLISQMENNSQKQVSFKGKKEIMADETAILSPVTKRAQREAFKVINALRKQYGEFDTIVIETTRDKNSEERKKRLRETQKFYEQQNKQVDELLKERGYDLTKLSGKTKTKVRLYLQQEGKSAYTLKPLDLDSVIRDETYTEIDHIIPISISLDDSFNNKALITHGENQAKGNMTPYGAYQNGKFADSGCDYAKYNTFVKNAKNIPYRKKQNLLFEENINKFSVIQEFINRNLVDTSYANRVVLNTLTQYFKDNEIPTKVHTIRGALTDKFRTQIQLKKDREEDYLHHAIDALIVASVKKMNLLNGYLSKYSFNQLYDETTGEVLEIPNEKAYFDTKYIQFIVGLKNLYYESNQFYNGLIAREKMQFAPIKLSHKVNTKPNRQVADETIYSTRKVDGQDILIEKIKNIYDPKMTRLTDDIINQNSQKYLMAKHDPQTFELIEKIIIDHFNTYKDSPKHYKANTKKGIITYQLVGENPLTAYKNEFGFVCKYSKKGNGPAIISMKYESEQLGNHIDISSNYNVSDKKVILKQLSPYRTDFYQCSDGKYRFVTIYYKDVHYQKSIGKYIIDKTWYQKEMDKKKIDDKAQFLFSLHRDELLGVVKNDGEKYIYDLSKENDGDIRYHDGQNVEILKFTATNNDKKGIVEVKPIYTYCKKQLMISPLNFKIISKYATDVLGNLYEVRQNILKLEFD